MYIEFQVLTLKEHRVIPVESYITRGIAAGDGAFDLIVFEVVAIIYVGVFRLLFHQAQGLIYVVVGDV